jgi:RNA polymerase sigma factor (sigma-70 family)
VHISVSAKSKWPARLGDLCLELRHPKDPDSLGRARGTVWLLLNSLLSQHLRYHVHRQGQLPHEDLEDLASDKSLELLRKLEKGTWDVTGRSQSEISGYLSMVARNGLVDRLRRAGRWVRPADDRQLEEDLEAASSNPDADLRIVMESPDKLVERREYAMAIRDCIEQLEGRSRIAWFLRVLCGMSSKQIAVHPKVSLNASHVDVLMQRARGMVKDCMRRKGFSPQDMPPGTFVELWKACQLDHPEQESGATT